MDVPLLCLPPFVATLLAVLFGRSDAEVSLAAWLLLVVAVDVAHVYGTLFRTYWHPEERRRHGGLLYVVPAACWAIGVALYAFGPGLFWRVFAYVAVFHFVRQQYGFLRIYSRKDGEAARRWAWLDALVVYLGAGWPLLYWHAHLPREFHWFVEGDFVPGLPPAIANVALVAYVSAGVAYVVKETLLGRRGVALNVPKQLILLGTALSWGVGIVAFEGDLAFTLTNVLSHGIPYLGLTWIYGRRQRAKSPEMRVLPGLSYRAVFAAWGVPLFLALLVGLAYVEEGLWDALVWRERGAAFGPFWHWLGTFRAERAQIWLVPLLALPQATHYVLDGFIWRLREAGAPWRRTLLPEMEKVS